jgi:hypothetical protein
LLRRRFAVYSLIPSDPRAFALGFAGSRFQRYFFTADCF